ncbi:MAG TPA: SPW repeat protein [Hyphomicrobiaceae bacterium]|jgi:hypothetical protein|nr:SPW repeat protein [Hyphomicrobiaceae bacterium]
MIGKLVHRRKDWLGRREWPLDLYKLALALVLFASPWWFAFAYPTARIEAWTAGLALLVVSIGALIAFVVWEEWLALVLGLWMIAAPWLLQFPPAATKIHVAVGLLVTYLAALELWLIHYDASSH